MGQAEARQRMQELIQISIAGRVRTRELVQRIEALLQEWFPGTALKEELDFYLKMYTPGSGGPGRIGDEELANTLLLPGLCISATAQ